MRVKKGSTIGGTRGVAEDEELAVSLDPGLAEQTHKTVMLARGRNMT